ncbi:MAG: DUF3054 domain-containing protein [Armatimonadota bacterium]|nr:DUF3054 domain-containing protein [Armatimonadota bacterium]MDR7452280.1 DUF3054 domain-containing protein [Armatimonadota bacterium]MDR7467956.1 DUF3054 domain-containing protein [Armatimonadota bacterium]MDR7494798.1 DUF3054 domain-containing protein [Armatimonadota bacterium]MDR7499247.1 DUF3054 domain-containing protein [Armatimonadota bacterium]
MSTSSLRILPGVLDGVALLGFLLVGLRTHGAPLTPAHILRDGLPLLGAWYLVAAIIRLYRHPRWAAVVTTWAIAVPVGILIRQWWVGRLFTRATPVFLVTALTFTLAFLLAGRLVAALLARLVGRRVRGRAPAVG